MLEPRKNVEALLEAWREVRKSTEIDLVIAGPRRAEAKLPSPQPGLILRGEAPEEELPELYSGASAFVYPSHYEGFGLPVLEAMQCGAPVIVSTDPALRETAGDAGLCAGSTRELVEAMRAVLTNLSFWRARSLARAGLFSWERTARATHAVYQELAFPKIH
jgi:glycosyltransferase involved in cell wall biosynthesis